METQGEERETQGKERETQGEERAMAPHPGQEGGALKRKWVGTKNTQSTLQLLYNLVKMFPAEWRSESKYQTFDESYLRNATTGEDKLFT